MFLSFHFTTHYAFDSIMLKYIYLYVFVFSTHQQRAFKLIFYIDSIRNFGKLWRHWKNTHNVRFFLDFSFLNLSFWLPSLIFFLALWSIVIFPALITLIVSTCHTHYLSIYLFWILIWGHTWVTCWMHSKRITLSLSVFFFHLFYLYLIFFSSIFFSLSVTSPYILDHPEALTWHWLWLRLALFSPSFVLARGPYDLRVKHRSLENLRESLAHLGLLLVTPESPCHFRMKEKKPFLLHVLGPISIGTWLWWLMWIWKNRRR